MTISATVIEIDRGPSLAHSPRERLRALAVGCRGAREDWRMLLKRAFASGRDREREEREASRRELRARPMSDAWRAILERDLSHYKRLTEAQCSKLHGDVHVFLAVKDVEGVDGFVIDDRVRVLVAASAALLVLGRDIALYDHVRRIVIRDEVAYNVGGHYQQGESRLGDEVVERWTTPTASSTRS